MVEYSRKWLKENWPELLPSLQKAHVSDEDHVTRALSKHKPVAGLTHTRGYFRVLNTEPATYIQYDMDYIIVDPKKLPEIGRRISRVIIFDSEMEYLVAFNRAMHSKAPEDQTGISN